MAYIIGTKRPEAETGQPQQLVAGQPSMIGTQATTGFQAQSGGAPQSTFTNLQRYIEANQGNVGGLVSAVGKQQEQVEQPFQAEKQRAEEAQKQATQAMTGRTQAQSSITGALEKAKTTPTQLTPQEIQNIRNLASTYNYNPAEVGKQLGQSTAVLRQQLGEGGAVASGLQALQTPTGVRQALLTQRQAPRASLGGLELDTFLLGATPGAQEQIAQRLAGRTQTLGEQLSPFEQTVQAISGTTGLTGQDIQKQLSGALTGFQTGLPSTFGAQTSKIDEEIAKIKALVASPQTAQATTGTPIKGDGSSIPLETDIIQRGGFGAGGLGSTERLNPLVVRDLVRKNIATSRADILTPEQQSKYVAYATLAGQSPEEITKFLTEQQVTPEQKSAIVESEMKRLGVTSPANVPEPTMTQGQIQDEKFKAQQNLIASLISMYLQGQRPTGAPTSGSINVGGI